MLQTSFCVRHQGPHCLLVLHIIVVRQHNIWWLSTPPHVHYCFQGCVPKCRRVLENHRDSNVGNCEVWVRVLWEPRKVQKDTSCVEGATALTWSYRSRSW